jgi:undecaprenyl pyrophosphate synthase
MGKLQTKSDGNLGVKLSGTFEKGQHITLNQDTALQKIFGTQHPELAEALMTHCLKVLKSTEASDDYPANDERVFMLGAVAELKPRDAVERMLAVQMAATHVAMIRSGRWLANADTMDQVQAHYTGYTKLARTYAIQMEALRKHRNGGKQTVTVQHVNVADGGQAIVGDVSHGGEGCR